MTLPKPSDGAADVAVALRKDTVFVQCLQQASAGGRGLLGSLIADAAASVHTDGGDVARENLLKQAVALLQLHKAALCERFPAELLRIFQDAIRPTAALRTTEVAPLRFDQLELMDDTQVQEKLELARAQQAAILDADAALTPLNALICAVRGLSSIRPDANPLRPASYVMALQNVFASTALPPAIRLDWLSLVSPHLGRRLCEVYADLVRLLTTAGVVPAAYAVTASSDGTVRGRSVGLSNSPTRNEAEDSLESMTQHELGLTVDQLRRLLAGKLDTPQGQLTRPVAVMANAPHEASAGFDHTVPDVLTTLPASQPTVSAKARSDTAKPTAFDATELAGLSRIELQGVLRQQAAGMDQVVGLEVVAMLISNMSKDRHLLPAVQSVVRALEQPLLRLALVDQRFFSDTQHPARQLLDAIAEHNARFEQESDPGFARFIQPLRRVVDDLQPVPIEGPEPFALSLATLTQAWGEDLEKDRRGREHAQNTLRLAEERNLIAVQVAAEIRARPDVAQIPESVMNFVIGPWAQVIALARMGVPLDDGVAAVPAQSPSLDASQSMALVVDLFWSAHPDWSRADPNRLVKLIPGLLSRIRTGLKTIQYPQSLVNAFFEVLMSIHQKAMMSRVAVPPLTMPTVPGAHGVAHAPGQVWLAPNEVQVSGFLLDTEFPEFTHRDRPAAPDMPSGIKAGLEPLALGSNASVLALGTWVEITMDRDLMRAQLVWASPKGTMYMFTTSTGRNQSMTRSSVDRLIETGKLLLVARQNIVGNALDAVAQAALRNSLDAS